jgi:hypothetical protein
MKQVGKGIGNARPLLNKYGWISLIMNCVKTVNCVIIVNGTLVRRIVPSRGIRQGDPLSPYLFILCAEALSSLLQHTNTIRKLTCVPTSKRGSRINHIFSADDSLLFCKANSLHWCRLTRLLNIYEKAFGQKLNQEKSSILFSQNTSQKARDQLLEISRIQAMQRY